MKVEKPSNLDRYIFLWALSGFTLFYTMFFSPILFSGNIFLSDGQWAAFYSELTLWSDDWAGGWPAAADLTQFMFNPLRHIFRFFSGGFNFFVISSYVLISTFMFGFMYDLTRSKFAAVISGLILGLGGFMIAHLGHTAMINGAAWTPLLLWSLSRIRQNLSSLWLLLGSCSISLMFISGHPQITVYSCLLGGVYAIFLGTVPKILGWRYWITVTSLFSLGFGIAAFQWLPTYELSGETFRVNFPYEEFISYSLPLRQTITFVLPFLFGSQNGSFNGDYRGAPNCAELSGYVGVIGIALAAIAFVVRRDRIVIFWTSIAVVSLLLALGGSLPWLAKLIFNIPLINQFRVPGRHIYEFTVAVSVLAGLGLAALEQGKTERKIFFKIVIGLGISFLLVIFSAFYVSNELHQESVGGLNELSLNLFKATILPSVWIIIFILIILFVVPKKFGNLRLILLVLLVLSDMVTFGWFHEWRDSHAPIIANEKSVLSFYYHEALKSQRKLVGTDARAFSPDRARAEGVKSLNWYGPLMLKRFSEVTGINQGGILDHHALVKDHIGIELFGGRYLFTSHANEDTLKLNGIPQLKAEVNLGLGDGCGVAHPMTYAINLPKPVRADQLSMVSFLGCSVHFKDGQPMVDIKLNGVDDQYSMLELRAGEETAEWALDCQDVAPKMQHRRATVFSSWEVIRPNIPACQGHSYIATLRFPQQDVTSISISARKGVAAIVKGISLADTTTGHQHTVDPNFELSPDRWHFLQAAGNIDIYENNWSMPPAWLVYNVILATPEEALKSIRTSALPNGQRFLPTYSALVEGTKLPLLPTKQHQGEAQIIQHDNTYWKIITRSDAPALLVVRQNYYPGWQAFLDGIDTDIKRTNYNQQGIYIPAGEHIIELNFLPNSFLLGCIISIICLATLAIVVFRSSYTSISSSLS